MNIKLLLQHGTSIYDATPILEGRVEWFASVMGKAGRLKFRVVRDGIVNFVEGDRVSFYVDSVLRFSGFVMTKERTSEQIISVTAYDQMFYLVRNKGTYVFLNKSAKEIIQTIGADYGLEIGYINDGGWRIPQRIEEGETLRRSADCEGEKGDGSGGGAAVRWGHQRIHLSDGHQQGYL